jgi:hypothetical protein
VIGAAAALRQSAPSPSNWSGGALRTTKSVAVAGYRSATPLNFPNIAAILPPKATHMTFFRWIRNSANAFHDNLNGVKEII